MAVLRSRRARRQNSKERVTEDGDVLRYLESFAPQFPVRRHVVAAVVQPGGALSHDVADDPVDSVLVDRDVPITVVGERHSPPWFALSRPGHSLGGSG